MDLRKDVPKDFPNSKSSRKLEFNAESIQEGYAELRRNLFALKGL